MDFRITGLAPDPFIPLYGLDDESLARRGVRRYVVDERPGFPDRVTMRDIPPGERALLLNFTHQPADTPYRASHAIYVREGARERYEGVNEIPEVMRRRILSLRAFDAVGMMLAADVAQGEAVEPLVRAMLGDSRVAYIHAHNAKQGCYSGRIDRV